MMNEKVYKWLNDKGYADRIKEHKETIDTVEHAAQQIGCTEAEIAKALSFIVDDKPVVVVMAGDGRVTIYSHLQACGIIKGHDEDCPCFKKINKMQSTVNKRRDKEVY